MIRGKQWMDIRQLYAQGMKIKQIAEMLNLNRKTVRKYIKSCNSPKYNKAKERPSILDHFKYYIQERLKQVNLTALRIFEEIKIQGYTGEYVLVAKYVAKIKNEIKNQAVLRFETLPGEQSQIDWGYFGRIYDYELKKWIDVHCFLIILGFSRKLYIEFFTRAHIENFLKGHNNAFEYFGGYTREMLYDNLKSVVIKRALKAEDSDFNKKFMDFAGYYGFKPILCRPYKPNTKGKVENSVNYAKQNFYAGREFSSLRELNIEAKKWLEKINQRIHATTKEVPNERAKREILNTLENKPLYDISFISYRKVFKDCFFSYNANRYSVPYQYAGCEIAIKESNNNITVLYREKEIAQHELELNKKGLYIKKEEHFAGLLEKRISHTIRRPKTKNKKINVNNINLININKNIINTPVMIRTLKEYEEVVTCR